MMSARFLMGSRRWRSCCDGALHRTGGAQRMRPAGFAEAAQQHAVAALQEHQARVQALLELGQHRRATGPAAAFADVNHHGRIQRLGRVDHQFGEAGNQFHRQIVDAVVPQILEDFEGGNLA